jgi:hypothetical protein
MAYGCVISVPVEKSNPDCRTGDYRQKEVEFVYSSDNTTVKTKRNV